MAYEVDDEAVATRVTVSVVLTNTSSDRIFESYGIPAPAEAAGVRARTAAGASLRVSTEAVPESTRMQRLHVPLGKGLRPGQTWRATISYLLGRQPPRSETLTQANEAVFMFPLRPLGDPGRSSIVVRIPASYDVEVVGSRLERREQGDEVVLSAEAIDDAGEFFAVVLALDDSRLVRETVEVAGTAVELRAWPGDDEWLGFVKQHVEDGAGVLEELIGSPWPERETLTIVETMTPVARGYGGWYDPAEHTIRIGNQLDAQLVLHELSHVWINFETFEERWLLEGLAEEYAHRAVLALGGPPERERPDPVSAGRRLLPLSEWTTPTFGVDDDEDVEMYGYAASWHVVGTIVEEIGTAALAGVVQAARDGTLTYPGDSRPEPLEAPMDWRRALDLFENIGGSRRAARLFDSYVVSGGDRAELEARSAARESYGELAERGGDWAPPLAVRRLMAEWRFDAALAGMAQAEAVLDLRDRISTTLGGLDIPLRGLEDDYETASDVSVPLSAALGTLRAAYAYRVAEHRAQQSTNLLETVGLWGSDTDGQLREARLALQDGDPAAAVGASTSVAGRIDRAGRDGALRLAGAALATSVGVAVPLRRRRRFHDADGTRRGLPQGDISRPLVVSSPSKSGAFD